MTWLERVLLWALVIGALLGAWWVNLERLALRAENRELARALDALHADHRQVTEDMKKLAAATEKELKVIAARAEDSVAKAADARARIGGARATHEPKTNAVVWDWDGS